MTRDSLFGGELAVCQEKHGYRFAVDAVLLAGLSRVKPGDRIIELGTGCGVILLVLACRHPGLRGMAGVEIQPELARLARKNVQENRLADRIEIVEGDLRQVPSRFEPASFDLVLSNPPYRKPGSGRINPNRQKAVARHELAAALPDVFAAAHHLLPHGGRLALIYPASRIGHLLSCAAAGGFSPKSLTIIYSRPGSPGRLMHVECRKAGGEEARVEAPFYIYTRNGEYTDEMRRLYEKGVPSADGP